MRFLLVGNYGVGNIGDEALKEYFLQLFPEVEWQVLSAHPEQNELPRLPAGVRSFFRFRWLQTLRALWQSDGIVFGGGSLFTDVESVRACWLWWCHAFWAWLFRKKIILAFQGIGPHRTSIGKFFTRWVVKRAAYISVRDALSAHRALAMQPHVDVVESFDPVFSLFTMPEYNLAAQENLLIIPRYNSGDQLIQTAMDIMHSGRWKKVLCVLLQPDDERERQYSLQLRAKLSLPVEVVDVRTVDALAKVVSRGSFVLSQRYHGAIAALALGRELQVLPQAENDKIASIQQIIASIPLSSRRETLLQLVQVGESSLRAVLCA